MMKKASSNRTCRATVATASTALKRIFDEEECGEKILRRAALSFVDGLIHPAYS